ncbi:MAG: hypothetical protein EOP24_35765 [Hyphomicrobiales bacterium]|nr:MAG: hypothetical protein EOP24_35765 [Hyphomicrobiales bacterium]
MDRGASAGWSEKASRGNYSFAAWPLMFNDCVALRKKRLDLVRGISRSRLAQSSRLCLGGIQHPQNFIRRMLHDQHVCGRGRGALDAVADLPVRLPA